MAIGDELLRQDRRRDGVADGHPAERWRAKSALVAGTIGQRGIPGRPGCWQVRDTKVANDVFTMTRSPLHRPPPLPPPPSARFDIHVREMCREIGRGAFRFMPDSFATLYASLQPSDLSSCWYSVHRGESYIMAFLSFSFLWLSDGEDAPH